MRRRRDFEDDGRTIADMSDVSGLYTPSMDRSDPQEQKPAQPPFSLKERVYFAGMALKAALLIGLAFLVGLGLVIWLITLLRFV